MIEADHALVIDAAIDQVWDYVQDIRRWAALFPGCRACEVLNAHDSRWTVKVGAGGLVKTVNVLVHVEQWAGPECVAFTYRLEGEPVQGRGIYRAERRSAAQTGVTLQLQVEGSGPMAPMWEAVSKPLLPQLARSFASQLKQDIEATAAPAAAQPPVVTTAKAPAWAAAIAWLRRLWHTLLGAKA